MRNIVCKRRGCGRRKDGSVYLVSEPGRGELPLWVHIDPAIPFGNSQFRGLKIVDLELILAGKSMIEYLLDGSAERFRREQIQEPEIDTFGMPLRIRVRTGICLTGGLDALSDLYPKDISDIGFALRSLSALGVGKANVEIPVAFRMLQEKRYPAFLAAVWRLWNNCPNGKLGQARPWIRMAMMAINALEDALEI